MSEEEAYDRILVAVLSRAPTCWAAAFEDIKSLDLRVQEITIAGAYVQHLEKALSVSGMTKHHPGCNGVH